MKAWTSPVPPQGWVKLIKWRLFFSDVKGLLCMVSAPELVQVQTCNSLLKGFRFLSCLPSFFLPLSFLFSLCFSLSPFSSLFSYLSRCPSLAHLLNAPSSYLYSNCLQSKTWVLNQENTESRHTYVLPFFIRKINPLNCFQ